MVEQDGRDLGRERPALSRRAFLIGLSGLAVPAVAGWGVLRSRRGSPTLTVGVCDALAKRTASECMGPYAERGYEGLAATVERATGIKMLLRYYPFDDLLVGAAQSGQLDVVLCKTWTALRAARAAGQRFQRLADVPSPTGARVLRGVFIARKDGPVGNLEDIDGRPFAMGSDAQYESSFQARRALARAGVTPGDTVVFDSCLSVAALVWEGSVDAGVVSDYCVDHSGLQLVDDPGAFRVLARTTGVPFVTLAVAESVPGRVRAKLSSCLRGLSGSRVPRDLHTAGLIAPIPWSPEELETS